MKEYTELGHIIVGSKIRQLSETITNDANELYSAFDFDIDPKWFPIFYTLAYKESDNVVNIAKSINQSHASVSKLVNGMKAANLLKTAKDPKDQRVTNVSLSAKARKLIPNMERQCQAVDGIMKQLSQDMGFDFGKLIDTSLNHLSSKKLSERVEELDSNNPIRIVDFAPAYQNSFKKMNETWISQHWKMEAPDYYALDNPYDYIINKGGAIFMALLNNKPVGCCAIIHMPNHNHGLCYELAKMAVTEEAKGKGIGFLLGQVAIDRAKDLGAKRLYLESNSKLVPAVNLYKKLGFEHIDSKPSPYERCNVQMEQWLN